MDVNRGDRFTRLVSMSSPSLGLQACRDRTLPADDASAHESYACGDMNTSLIQTAKGRTIVLQHDVVSPRPYSRINLLSGTLATFADYPPRIFFDPANPHAPRRRREARPRSGSRSSRTQEARAGGIEDRFEHPLWTELEREREAERPRRHGLRDELAARAVPARGAARPTSTSTTPRPGAPRRAQRAVGRQGSAPVEFPDFTRGRWQKQAGLSAAGRAPTDARASDTVVPSGVVPTLLSSRQAAAAPSP